MTAQEIIEKIRAEIERRKKEIHATVFNDEFDSLLSFLDTLQEQPVKIDIRKELASIEFMGVNDARDSETIARHFYELGRQSKPRIVFSKEVFDQYDREQFINAYNAYKPKVSEGLEEEIEREWNDCDGKHSDTDYHIVELTKDDFLSIARHFAQWQKEQTEKRWLEDREGCFWDGVEEGKKAMREQMMKEAVEGCVSSTKGDHFGCVTSMPTDLGKLYCPDKVKLIIIKED